jgi:hypothetical protein
MGAAVAGVLGGVVGCVRGVGVGVTVSGERCGCGDCLPVTVRGRVSVPGVCV